MAIRLPPSQSKRIDDLVDYKNGVTETTDSRKKNRIIQKPIILDFRDGGMTKRRDPRS